MLCNNRSNKKGRLMKLNKNTFPFDNSLHLLNKYCNESKKGIMALLIITNMTLQMICGKAYRNTNHFDKKLPKEIQTKIGIDMILIQIRSIYLK